MFSNISQGLGLGMILRYNPSNGKGTRDPALGRRGAYIVLGHIWQWQRPGEV